MEFQVVERERVIHNTNGVVLLHGVRGVGGGSGSFGVE